MRKLVVTPKGKEVVDDGESSTTFPMPAVRKRQVEDAVKAKFSPADVEVNTAIVLSAAHKAPEDLTDIEAAARAFVSARAAHLVRAAELKAAVENNQDVNPTEGTVDGAGGWPAE